MNSRKVELHISQIQRVINSSRSSFPEHNKQKIYDELIELFNAILSVDFSTFSKEDLKVTRDALIDIFNGIEHLDYEEEDDLPKELIYCLDLVIDEWIDDSQDYFVVVSYNNTANQYYITARDEQELLKKQVEYLILFGCDYNQLLIQISKPKAVLDDFLGSTPVYHELGHFIDFNYQITRSLYDSDNTYRPDLKDDQIKGSYPRSKHLLHLREHFSDIFSAQYLGYSSTHILDYLAYEAKESVTHPSTKKRISVVKTFLEGTGPKQDLEIIDTLKNTTLKRTNGRELKIRYNDTFNSPFNGGAPVYLNQANKIHGILVQGWEYLESGLYIQEDNNDPIRRCARINKLIKNSILMSIP